MILRKCSRKKTKTISSVDSLTDDLLTEILLRIDSARSIYRCKTVCKRWNSVISSACFRDHAHHCRIPLPSMLILVSAGAESRYLLNPVGVKNFASILDKQKFYLLASCNDLLLLSPTPIKTWDDQGTYYLWNPFTQQISQLPTIPNIKISRSQFPSFGLVSKFSNGSHIFRVIRLPQLKMSVNLFDMYSSETSTWTQHEMCAEIFPAELVNINTTPFYFDGKIYWEGIHHQVIALDPFNLDNMICTIAYPPVQLPSNNSSNSLTLNRCVFGALEGRLRLFDLQSHSSPGSPWSNNRGKCLLSIWELNNSSSCQWSLVDQVYVSELVSLHSRVDLSKCNTYIFPLAMDTKDQGVVYIQHEDQCISCNIKRREVRLATDVNVETSYFRYYFQLGLPWIPTPVT